MRKDLSDTRLMQHVAAKLKLKWCIHDSMLFLASNAVDSSM